MVIHAGTALSGPGRGPIELKWSMLAARPYWQGKTRTTVVYPSELGLRRAVRGRENAFAMRLLIG